MSLAVVGAGFGRTGTLSLKAALEQLGFGRCHHMSEVFAHPEQAPVWHAAARGEAVDWDALLTGCRATVDWPSCHFWRALADHYPEAKVLLSVRDPARWYASMSETIFRVLNAPPPPGADDAMRGVGAMAQEIISKQTFGGKFDEAHAVAVFNRHVETVKETIPTERLLVFDVRDGWEPLCGFLGMPVPDAPFPRTNSREEFIGRSSRAAAP